MSAAPKVDATGDRAVSDEPLRRPQRVDCPHDLLTAHEEIAKQPHLWREAIIGVRLPPNSYRVGAYLIDICLNKKTGRCYPSQKTIAQSIGEDVRYVRHGIQGLKTAGLIFTKKRSYSGSNDVFFYIPERLRSDTTVSFHKPHEVTPPCRTNSHGGGGGSDTLVSDYITLEGTLERTTEGSVGAGEVGAFGGPSDSSSLRSEDLSCCRDHFELEPDLLEEGRYL